MGVLAPKLNPNKMKQTIQTIGVFAILVVLLVGARGSTNLGALSSGFNIFDEMTNSRSELTSTATTSVAYNGRRQYLKITNYGADAWLVASSSIEAATTSLRHLAFFLPATTTIEFTGDNIYRGAIQAYTITTTTLTILEK